jgi:hypothetical protein
VSEICLLYTCCMLLKDMQCFYVNVCEHDFMDNYLCIVAAKLLMSVLIMTEFDHV